MKIVVDENMPHARELFAEFGEVIPLPGRQMLADKKVAEIGQSGPDDIAKA